MDVHVPHAWPQSQIKVGHMQACRGVSSFYGKKEGSGSDGISLKIKHKSTEWERSVSCKSSRREEDTDMERNTGKLLFVHHLCFLQFPWRNIIFFAIDCKQTCNWGPVSKHVFNSKYVPVTSVNVNLELYSHCCVQCSAKVLNRNEQ